MRGRTDGAGSDGAPAPDDQRRRWSVLAVSICVAVPSVLTAIRAVRWGWVPVGDQATISTRAVDVLSGHTPLLGQLSGVSAEVGLTTRSPGPIGYWPFALTARWGPFWGTAVVAAVLSGTAMVAAVRLAARRGGPGLALALGLGLVLSTRAINPGALVSTWNPALGVMPLVLLVLLAWSVAVGELRLVPVTVLVASFCAQVHSVFAVAALPVLVVGLAVGLVTGTGRDEAGRRTRRRLRPGSGRALALGAAVGLVCWALPLIDQVTGDPGNLTRLTRAPPGEPSAWPVVRRVIVDAAGWPPAFLGGDRLPDVHVRDVFLASPPTPSSVTVLVVVAALVLVGALAARRRDREVVVPVVLVLALLGAGAMVVRATPGPLFLTLTYTTWWLIPTGMLAWLVLLWAGLRLASAGVRAEVLRDRLARSRAGLVGPVVIAVGCVVIVAVGVLSPARPEPDERIHAEARTAGDAVASVVDPGGRYLVVGQGRAPLDLVASTAYRIRRAGARPVVEGNDGVAAGPRYVPVGRRCDGIVTLLDSDAAPVPPGGRAIVRVPVPSRDGSVTDVRVDLSDDRGAPSC